MPMKIDGRTRTAVLKFIESYDAENGRGGVSAASRKYKVTRVTIARWMAKAGTATKKAKSAKKIKAAKIVKVAAKRGRKPKAIKAAPKKRGRKPNALKAVKAAPKKRGRKPNALKAIIVAPKKRGRKPNALKAIIAAPKKRGPKPKAATSNAKAFAEFLASVANIQAKAAAAMSALAASL